LIEVLSIVSQQLELKKHLYLETVYINCAGTHTEK